MEQYESVTKFSPVNGNTKILMLALPLLGKNVFFFFLWNYMFFFLFFFKVAFSVNYTFN